MIQKMAELFEEGDTVSHLGCGPARFFGKVIEVQPKLGKVMVSWSGQKPTQHTPDELVLAPDLLETRKTIKVARSRKADSATMAPTGVVDSLVKGMSPAFEQKSVSPTPAAEALQKAVDSELTAATLYWKAAMYFHAIGLEGLSKWAGKEGGEEVTHALRVIAVLETLGIAEAPKLVDAAAMSLPNGMNWTNPKMVADDILAGENFVLSVYKSLNDIATSANDAFIAKFAQDVIEEQTKAVDTAQRIQQKIAGACDGKNDLSNMMIMDSIIGDGIPFEMTASARRVASDIHGVEKPRGGGFSIMEDLQKDLHKESEDKAGLKTARSRTAMYWTDKGRVYRMTRNEVDGTPVCPKCKSDMERRPFTKSDKLLACTKCTFIIPLSSVVTEKPSVTIETNEDTGTKTITIS
jgi:ferritin